MMLRFQVSIVPSQKGLIVQTEADTGSSSKRVGVWSGDGELLVQLSVRASDSWGFLD
jgi:hypothetical protein